MLCNVVLYRPNIPSLLNLRAYDDVAKTVAYGLQQAGHAVQLTINSFLRQADRYFLFAAHLMPTEMLDQFPVGSVSFNLEQLHGHTWMTRSDLSPPMQHIIQNFQVVEYSTYNMPYWLGLEPERMPIVLPIPYGENLIIKKTSEIEEDIDVLYYGSIGGERKLAFLMAAMGKGRIKPKIVLMQNVYGVERDHFINRSRIVLSATGDRIFPEVRASYLMANSKAVISDIGDEDLIDPLYRENLIFATKDDVEEKIYTLLSDDVSRVNYAQHCHQIIRGRDISSYIQAIL